MRYTITNNTVNGETKFTGDADDVRRFIARVIEAWEANAPTENVQMQAAETARWQVKRWSGGPLTIKDGLDRHTVRVVRAFR